MKRFLANNDGIALVTALMLTLISLTIVMYLLLMVTSGIKQSGANKRYRSTLEAGYGATELITKEVLPHVFLTTINAKQSNPGTEARSLFSSSLNFTTETDACLTLKLTSPSNLPTSWPTAYNWDAACKAASRSSNAKTAPDFTMKLNATGTSADPFTVYAKIVSTECGDTRPYPDGKCTNSDISGIYLDGMVNDLQRKPALYKIEIQAERSTNALEKTKMGILYAY